MRITVERIAAGSSLLLADHSEDTPNVLTIAHLQRSDNGDIRISGEPDASRRDNVI